MGGPGLHPLSAQAARARVSGVGHPAGSWASRGCPAGAGLARVREGGERGLPAQRCSASCGLAGARAPPVRVTSGLWPGRGCCRRCHWGQAPQPQPQPRLRAPDDPRLPDCCFDDYWAGLVARAPVISSCPTVSSCPLPSASPARTGPPLTPPPGLLRPLPLSPSLTPSALCASMSPSSP